MYVCLQQLSGILEDTEVVRHLLGLEVVRHLLGLEVVLDTFSCVLEVVKTLFLRFRSC